MISSTACAGCAKDIGANTNGKLPNNSLLVCFGEILMDFVPTVGGFSLAEVPAFRMSPGGAPANVAVGISRLGCSSAFIGKLTFRDKTMSTMLECVLTIVQELHCHLLHSELIVKGNFFYRHLNADMHLRESELDINPIKQAGIFHYGSVCLIEERCRSAHLAAMNIARQSGSIPSYDPNLTLPLWASAEAARQGIISIWDQADVIKTFKGRAPGIKDKPVDTTGAGDAFVSGMLTSLASDIKLIEDEKLYFSRMLVEP
ncbi:Carbohydrate kinase PfkB - like 4 [Theobroma cacao]|nr:Carbohydrate kinase PfkB - like 4 [Theobroma cacao]